MRLKVRSRIRLGGQAGNLDRKEEIPIPGTAGRFEFGRRRTRITQPGEDQVRGSVRPPATVTPNSSRYAFVLVIVFVIIEVESTNRLEH